MDLSSVFDDELFRNESAKSFTLKTLRKAICCGILKEGTPLKQGEIASQLKVSHIPVREALRDLESQGLVTVYPYRGAVVASLSIAEVREIFDIRVFLETGALKRAIPVLTDIDIMKAEIAIKGGDSEKDVDRWSELNWEFHSALYLPARNSRLFKLIEDMHININRYLRIYLSLLDFQKNSQDGHRDILDACKNGDIERACHALEFHLKDACDHLVGFLGERS